MKNIENMLRSADARREPEAAEMTESNGDRLAANGRNENEFAPWDD